jgi:hypothetical protein
VDDDGGALLATLAFAQPAPLDADRCRPVPPATLTLAYKRRRPAGGEATLKAKIVDRVLRSGPFYEARSPAR